MPKVQEILAKNILSKSQVMDYALNPYVGCEHECRYCYARFMKRFTGHKENWREFVDAKINAPDLLAKEIKKKKVGCIWISGVCDPYQPIESKYGLTRSCLEILASNGWPVTIQTKSPLVLRDLDLIKNIRDVEVGYTITTADEKIKKFFEPKAPTIEARITALGELNSAGIKTYAMIAPLLPGAEELVSKIKGKVDYVYIDRMNYHYADWVYRKYNLKWARTDDFFRQKGEELAELFKKEQIPVHLLF
ncbi:MAG: SPL family radical SAM protein [Thermodesulfobacteriota bacterium]